eukprot:COSAG04_NODE_5408_length_1629_cov_1.305229_1_plen_345_part_01
MSSKKAAKKLKKNKKKQEAAPRALFVAAYRGDCGAMGRLIDGGVDVNALVEDGRTDDAGPRGQPRRSTALFQAVGSKHEAAAQLLLDHGADPNITDSLGNTPLIAAAFEGSLPVLRMLIEAKVNLNAVEPDYGWTALHFACWKGNTDCAEALVRAGCDTSLRTPHGMTGRDIAQQAGHTAVLERLAALEKAPETQSQKARTTAEQGKSTAMSSKKAAKKLKKKKQQKTQLEAGIEMLNAARHGDCGAVTRLLDGGMDVDALVETGHTDPVTRQPVRTTALHQALLNKQEAATQLLLDRGADPNLASSTGFTPLMAAAAQGSLPLLRLLIEAKAELNTVNPNTGGT